MELAVDPFVGSVPGGACGDLGLPAVDGELVHGRLVETSGRSTLNMSEGQEMEFNSKEWEVAMVINNFGSQLLFMYNELCKKRIL